MDVHWTHWTSIGRPMGRVGRPMNVQWDAWDVPRTSQASLGRPKRPTDVPSVPRASHGTSHASKRLDVPRVQAWDVPPVSAGTSKHVHWTSIGRPLDVPWLSHGTRASSLRESVMASGYTRNIRKTPIKYFALFLTFARTDRCTHCMAHMTHDCHVGRVRRQWLSHGAPGTSYGCPTGHIGSPRVVQWDTWDVHWTSIGRPTCPLDVPLVLWDVPLDAWDARRTVPWDARDCHWTSQSLHKTHLFVIAQAGGGKSVHVVRETFWVAHGMGVFDRVAHARVVGR